MTAERRSALEGIAAEVRACTRCRLNETRTHAVPGEGDADTEVVFVGEGPGQNEDREGRPFVGRAGRLLVDQLASIGWRREDVFITNVVKCRPPGNRDPEPDEIAACAPFLRRQLEVLDPAVVATLGRFSMATFMPGVRITQAHGTTRPVDPETGASDASVLALYHPAYALRNPAVERESFEDMARLPDVLIASRARRRGDVEASREPRDARDRTPEGDRGGPEEAVGGGRPDDTAGAREPARSATMTATVSQEPLTVPPASADDQLTLF